MTRPVSRLILLLTIVIGAGCSSSQLEKNSESGAFVFFLHRSMEQEDLRTSQGPVQALHVYPRPRQPGHISPVRNLIFELLKGPTAEEAALGFTSLVSGLVLEEMSQNKDTLFVAFTGELMLEGLMTGAIIRAQIEKTLLQFETVKTVKIRINGLEDFDSMK